MVVTRDSRTAPEEQATWWGSVIAKKGNGSAAQSDQYDSAETSDNDNYYDTDASESVAESESVVEHRSGRASHRHAHDGDRDGAERREHEWGQAPGESTDDNSILSDDEESFAQQKEEQKKGGAGMLEMLATIGSRCVLPENDLDGESYYGSYDDESQGFVPSIDDELSLSDPEESEGCEEEERDVAKEAWKYRGGKKHSKKSGKGRMLASPIRLKRGSSRKKEVEGNLDQEERDGCEKEEEGEVSKEKNRDGGEQKLLVSTSNDQEDDSRKGGKGRMLSSPIRLYKGSSMKREVEGILSHGFKGSKRINDQKNRADDGNDEADELISDWKDESDEPIDDRKDEAATEDEPSEEKEASGIPRVSTSDSTKRTKSTVLHLKFTPERVPEEKAEQETDEEVQKDSRDVSEKRMSRAASMLSNHSIMSSTQSIASMMSKMTKASSVNDGLNDAESRQGDVRKPEADTAASEDRAPEHATETIASKTEKKKDEGEVTRFMREKRLTRVVSRTIINGSHSIASKVGKLSKGLTEEERKEEEERKWEARKAALDHKTRRAEEKFKASIAKSEAKRLEAEIRRIEAEQKLKEAREKRAAAVANAEARRLEAEARRIEAEQTKREAEERMAAIVAATETARLQEDEKKAFAEMRTIEAERSRSQVLAAAIEEEASETQAEYLSEEETVSTESPSKPGENDGKKKRAAMMGMTKKGLSMAGNSFLIKKRKEPQSQVLSEAYYVQESPSFFASVNEDSVEIVAFKEGELFEA